MKTSSRSTVSFCTHFQVKLPPPRTELNFSFGVRLRLQRRLSFRPFKNQQSEVCCIPVFSKIDFRHPCKHRKSSAGLIIIVAESCLAYEQSCIFLRRPWVSASVHVNHLPRKKATRGRKRKKKGSLTGCWKDYCWFPFVFWCVYSCMSVSTLSQIFFDLVFFPSSSTKGHRKYLPFIQGKLSEPSASGLFGR